MEGYGRLWNVMEGQGRSLKVMKGLGRSCRVWKVTQGGGRSWKVMEGYPHQVHQVVDPTLPRERGALLGQHTPRPSEVAGSQPTGDVLLHHLVLRVLLGHHPRHLAVSHVVQQLGEIQRGNVGLQGPGGIGVAHDEGEVGHVADHDAVVDEVVGSVVLLAVDEDLHGAEGEVWLHGEAGGGDDEVGVHMLLVLHLDPLLGQVVDVPGHHGGLSLPDDGRDESAVDANGDSLRWMDGWMMMMIPTIMKTKTKIINRCKTMTRFKTKTNNKTKTMRMKPDRFKEVPSRSQAEPLLPGIVWRVKVLLKLLAGHDALHLLVHAALNELLGVLRVADAVLVEDGAEHHGLPTVQADGQAGGQPGEQELTDWGKRRVDGRKIQVRK